LSESKKSVSQRVTA